MNPLYKTTIIGTAGELLVQLRLLKFGIQAAPPLKDSGNDLIGIKGDIFKAIQVKTSTGEPKKPRVLNRRYHLLIFVELVSDEDIFLLDQSKLTFILQGESFSNRRVFTKHEADIIWSDDD